MNEVEKMYSNSGIEKHKKTMLDIETGKDVLTLDSFYPEFTAEKQLELIKWLAKFDDFYVLKDFEFDKYRSLCGLVASEYIDTFEEMLANLILNIWDELTKEQKAQIKNILE